MLTQEKARLFGRFKRTSIMPEPQSLSEILEHAKENNNRSRQVFIELGWMDKQGNLAADAPEALINCLASSDLAQQKHR